MPLTGGNTMVVLNTFTPGAVITASGFNENFNDFADVLSGIATMEAFAGIDNIPTSEVDTTEDWQLLYDVSEGRFKSKYLSAREIQVDPTDPEFGAVMDGNMSGVTITIAAPGVVTFGKHGFPADTPIWFSTTGSLPTGIVAGTKYYVKAVDSDSFQVAATPGGSAITTSGSQSGAHTCIGGTENTTAWNLAIARVNVLNATGRHAQIYVPSGGAVFNTATPLTPFFGGGRYQGEGAHCSFMLFGPAYAGNICEWSEAWDGKEATPFIAGGGGKVVNSLARFYMGAGACDITFIGDRNASSNQHVFQLYDRNDFVHIDRVNIFTVKGRGFCCGYTRDKTQAYMRESYINNLRMWSVGDTDLPCFEMCTTGSGDSTNSNKIGSINLIAVKGPGVVIRNKNTSKTLGIAHADWIRVERASSDTEGAGDLFRVGDSDSAFQGGVAEFNIGHLELIGAPSGYGSFVTASPDQTSGLRHTNNKISKLTIGTGDGKGIVHNAGSFYIYVNGIATTDTKFTVGPTSGGVGATFIEGVFSSAWSTSVDSSAESSIRLPITYSTSMPNSGWYKAGQLVINSTPSLGVALAWYRAVTGSSHVLGTDWLAVYAPDTDGTLAGNSDTRGVTQKAVKTYADLKLAKASNLSDLASVSTSRTNLGLGTGDSPTFVAGVLTEQTSVPSAPSSGFDKIYVDDTGIVFRMNANGRLRPMNIEHGQRHRLYALNNTAAAQTLGQTGTSDGTATAVSISNTNYVTRQVRSQNVSAASSAANFGIRSGTSVCFLADPCLVNFKFAVEEPQSGQALFIGLRNSSAVHGDVDPSSFTNIIGIGVDAGQTTFRLLNNDGSGSATAADLGANFPSNSATAAYELMLWWGAGATKVYYQLVRLDTPTLVASGAISSDIPATTTALAQQIIGSTRAGSSAVTLSWSHIDVYKF